MTVTRAITIVAQAVVANSVSIGDDDWEDFPDVGEHDWEMVVHVADAIAAQPDPDELHAALVLLAARAEEEA